MKTYILLLVASISIAFTACSLNGSSNKTPQISFVTKPHLNTADSLNTPYLTDNAGVYMMDSINVGDTVSFRIFLDGFSNNLISYYITRSDTTTTKIILPSKTSLDSVFISSTSNYSVGKFIFKSKILNLYFPFKYVAKKQSNDAKISFALTSDAYFDTGLTLASNTFSFVLKTPIRKAK